MNNVMTKKELIQDISKDLFDAEMLTRENYNNIEDLLREIECFLESKLQDYTIIPGWPLE